MRTGHRIIILHCPSYRLLVRRMSDLCGLERSTLHADERATSLSIFILHNVMTVVEGGVTRTLLTYNVLIFKYVTAKYSAQCCAIAHGTTQ